MAVCPATTDELTGCAVIEGATAVPAPVIWTTNGELSCELLKEATLDALPVLEGAKLAVKVALLPGFRFTGKATPPIAKLAPEALA